LQGARDGDSRHTQVLSWREHVAETDRPAVHRDSATNELQPGTKTLGSASGGGSEEEEKEGWLSWLGRTLSGQTAPLDGPAASEGSKLKKRKR